MGYISNASDAGFPASLLIPVCPPIAHGIEPGGLGKAPALPSDEPGYWRNLSKWQNGVSEHVRAFADKQGANCGLILGIPVNDCQFVCVDFDLLTGEAEGDALTSIAKGLCKRFVSKMQNILGRPVWVRDTRTGRAAVLCKIVSSVPPGTKDVYHLSHPQYGSLGKIELLARGQQVVIAGDHQVTKRPITWTLQGYFERLEIPTVDSYIPEFATREDLNRLMQDLLADVQKIGVTFEKSRSLNTNGEAVSRPAEEQAPPNADILITLLEELPHDKRIDRDTYVTVMHGVVGCLKALKELDNLTPDNFTRIIHTAISWAAKWEDPRGVGTTYEAEEKKFREDWMKANDIRAGWLTLMNIATNMGVEDVRIHDAAERFDALEPPLPYNPLHDPLNRAGARDLFLPVGRAEIFDESAEPVPTAATGYLSSDAMDDINRPRVRLPGTLDVHSSDIVIGDAVEKSISSRAIWIEEEKRWIVWQGAGEAWSSLAGDRITKSWIEYCLDMQVQKHFQGAKVPDGLKAKLLSVARIEAVEKLMRIRLGRRIGESSNKNILQTPIGAFNLSTGEKLSMDEQRKMVEMRRTNVSPINRPTPIFDEVISLMCGRDEEVINWLWHYIGYLCLGYPIGHNMLVIHGPGGNGKGAVCRTLQKVFGEYAIEADRELVLESGRQRHKTTLFDLKGKRYWFISELPPGETWNEAQIKALTGGDRIQANKMRSDFTYFASEGTFIIATNNLPRFNKVDDAILRRFFIISARLKPEVKDLRIEDKIVESGELQGILFKAMQYAKRVWDAEFKLPPTPISMLKETQRYFNDQDSFFAWYSSEVENIPASGTGGVEVDELKGRYDAYVRRHAPAVSEDGQPLDTPPMRLGTFLSELKRCGCALDHYTNDDGRRITIARGLRLKVSILSEAANAMLVQKQPQASSKGFSDTQYAEIFKFAEHSR
jgi:P4 family phage/plasmid primase-like protien